MMNIILNKVSKSKLAEVDFNNIPFGKLFTDHMFQVDYDGKSWVNPRIIPFGNLSLSPALSSLHYGQSIFEGMKASKNPKGDILTFRPQKNHQRLNASARRLCMPEISEELFIGGLTEWLKLEKDWIPQSKDASLYIRPFMFATDDYLGVKASTTYSLIIYGCPVGSYYNEVLKIKIEEHFVRAAKGGIGFVKAAGNYAASLYPASIAQKEGYHQLLWTDAITHEYIEELGTSNFFAVIDGILYTPKLDGTILEGITRESILKIATNMGIKVIEEPLKVSFVVQALQNQKLTEAFVTGTAATIAPIGLIGYRNEKFTLAESTPVSNKLKTKLNSIKNGLVEDTFGWNTIISVS